MQKANIPQNEAHRLAALQRYDILDTPAEDEFNDMVALASHICSVPIALVSLVDENRQWFKARVGLDADETTRDIAFCSHAILQNDVFVVENAIDDERFHDNPLVAGAPNIRFYAGAPLVTHDGFALGTLCAIDSKPHQLEEAQSKALAALARQVVRQMELRIHNRLLKAQNEDKVRLFGTLSHDLRTPFNSLLGYSDILVNRSGTLDVERVQQMASRISTSAKSAFEQLEGLLSWCQSQLNAVSFSIASVEIAPILFNLEKLLEPKVKDKKLTLQLSADGDLHAMADPDLLFSVLQNLLTNAVKFSNEESTVSLSVEDLGEKLRFSVKDSGIGLSSRQIEEINQRGRTVSNIGTSGEKGTGLGLLLVNEHLARMNSALTVKSAKGEGSEFSFFLRKA